MNEDFLALNKKQAYEKFKNIPMVFSSYYKYVFHFVGVATIEIDKEHYHYHIRTSYGGSSDDIYKFDVSYESPILFTGVQWDAINIVCRYYDRETKETKEIKILDIWEF